MVTDDIIKKYTVMEAPELRLRVISLDTECNILRAQLQSMRYERNMLLKKATEIDLNANENRPQQQNNSLPAIPKLNSNSPR
jgi:hypothetical protein